MKGYLKILLVVALALSGETVMAKVNQEALRAKIKSLEGISAEDKAALLELLNTQKKYGLVWETKSEAVEEKMREELPVLREVKERKIVGLDCRAETQSRGEEGEEDVSVPNHILIEGDNLHALTCLTYTHSNKVDVIYIDPPYNTGNKDFIYNDCYVDKDGGYRHSKWLSFMEKRLKIAKGLLSDKGVIFISIDDNEQAQLKLLCDEIFGERNFIGTFIWKKKKKGSHLSKTFRSMTEYAICFAKVISNVELYGEDAYSDKQQPIVKRTNSIKELVFPQDIIKTKLPDNIYPKGRKGTGTTAIEFLTDIIVRDGKIVNEIKVSGPFVWVQNKLDEEIRLGTEIFLSIKFGFNVLRSDQSQKIKRPSSLLTEEQGVGTNEDANIELLEIGIPEGTFSYPKPVSYIQNLVKFNAHRFKTATILDFFAGSGTTLHAVMKLNAEDGGKRTCILVTNNENGICEKVTYERNKRVIEGYTTPKGETVAGLSANTLRYYKTEFVPRKPSPRNARALMAASVDLLCVKNDLYTESPRFFGKKLKASVGRYFDDGRGNRMLVLFDEKTVPSVVSAIRDAEFEGVVKVYVFAHGDYAYNEEFEEVADKVELCALPAAITNAYRRVIGREMR